MNTLELREPNINNVRAVLAGGGPAKTKMGETVMHLCGMENPLVVIAPTATPSKEAFNKRGATWSKFFENLGARTAVLHKFGAPPNTELLEEADIAYFGGGSTDRLMKILQFNGANAVVSERTLNGSLTLCGISAGLIYPTADGWSDSNKYVKGNDRWPYKWSNGIGVIPNTRVTPHYDQPDTSAGPFGTRQASFHDAILSRVDTEGVKNTYLGVDNGAALVVIDGIFMAIRAESKDNAYTLAPDKESRKIEQESLPTFDLS